jgi:biotin carboxyl carrier protein
MTHSNHPGDDKRAPIAAGTALVLILLVAGGGFGIYRTISHWSGADIRAQEASQEPMFLVRQGSRVIVPEKSPVRNKLEIEPVEERDVQRTLTLPAVVEADPARTVKVLPPVTGRVMELKVQLGERVSKDQELAVLDSGDLAQALSDDEKARSQLKLTKQALDRLMILAKTSAVAVKDREQAENDHAQAQSELERAQSRLRAIGISADQKPPSRLLTLKAPITGSVIDLQVAAGHRADAGHRHQPLARGVLLDHSGDLGRQALDPLIEPPPVAGQVLDDAQHARREDVGALRQDAGQLSPQKNATLAAPRSHSAEGLTSVVFFRDVITARFS